MYFSEDLKNSPFKQNLIIEKLFPNVPLTNFNHFRKIDNTRYLRAYCPNIYMLAGAPYGVRPARPWSYLDFEK
jgi:hypothetical protein